MPRKLTTEEIKEKIWISPQEWVRLGGPLSVKTIYNLISSGKCPVKPKRFGRGIRFKLSDVMEYMEKTK